MMDEREILEKIVENEGSCTKWANKSICATCPMSRLKKQKHGGYYSCFEAICVSDLTEVEADKRYKEAAIRLLQDMSIEDMLIKE
jgi:hypothetical protein